MELWLKKFWSIRINRWMDSIHKNIPEIILSRECSWFSRIIVTCNIDDCYVMVRVQSFRYCYDVYSRTTVITVGKVLCAEYVYWTITFKFQWMRVHFTEIGAYYAARGGENCGDNALRGNWFRQLNSSYVVASGHSWKSAEMYQKQNFVHGKQQKNKTFGMRNSIERRNPVSTSKHVFLCRPFHTSGV
jgi:hypothetical protein